MTIFPRPPDAMRAVAKQDLEYTVSRVLWTILPKQTDLSQIRAAYAEDATFPRDKYTEKDGIYFTNQNQIVIPKVESLRD